jgi:hypothetical protein
MRRWLIAIAPILLLGSIAAAAAAERPRHGAKRPGVFFVGDFDTCDFSQWRTQGPVDAFRIVRSPTRQGSCAAALTVGPWAIRGLVNPAGDGAALRLDEAPYGTNGKSVWQHYSVRFARGFRATSGEWNLFIEWHNDNDYLRFGIANEYANLCWMIRQDHGTPRIGMRVMGGSSTAPRTLRVTGPKLRTGHWYDFRAHTVWSPDPKKGLVEWWLDGKRLYSHRAATLYTRPNGSVSRVYLIEDNYRRHADWDSTIYFDETRLGATRSSVRY